MLVSVLAAIGVYPAGTMVEHAKSTYPVLADATTQTVKDYRVYDLLDDGISAPTTFIIDNGGTIIWFHIGRDTGNRSPVEELLRVIGAPQA